MSEATDLPAMGEENYVGDGVYVSFDGYHVVLRVDRHGRPERVFLEPEVWQALQRWVQQYPRLHRYMGGRVA